MAGLWYRCMASADVSTFGRLVVIAMILRAFRDFYITHYGPDFWRVKRNW